MFGDGIKYKCRLCWRFIIGVSDHQQAPPSLTFASPWAKLNSAMDQELLQCSMPQKYTGVQSRILLQIRINWSDFYTYPYYLQPWGFLTLTWVLSNWKIERSNQALCLKFFVLPLFQSFYKFSKIKLRDSIVWQFQVSKYMWYLWILTKGSKDVMPPFFFFLQLQLMWSS